MENKRLKNAALTLIIGTGIILLMVYAQSLLVPIMISAFIAMLLVPLVEKMEQRRIPRILSIIIALLITLLFLSGLGFFFGSQISNFAQDLSGIEERFNQISGQVEAAISTITGVENALNFANINAQFFTFLKENAAKISGFAFSTLGRLGLVVLIPVYTFLFLLYRDHFTEFTIRLFRNESPEKVKDIVTDLRKVIQQYIVGMLKVMAILAVLNAIGLLILGIRHALFFAVFAAVLNVVPYVGPLASSIFPMIFALLTTDSLWYPIGVLIVFAINQTIEGNFLTPKIVGSNVSMNPMASLVALFIGGMIWGIVGMILFIPLAAMIKKILELSPRTEVYAFLMGEEDTRQEERRYIIKHLKKIKRRVWRVKNSNGD